MIDGLHLIFVELPKFSPHTYSEKKMQVLWLRYLTEINENTREVPEDLIDNPEVKKAINALEESAFTDAQLLGYENFWDIISVEKTLYNSAERRGLKKVSSKRSLKLPEKMKSDGLAVDFISNTQDCLLMKSKSYRLQKQCCKLL